MLIISAHSIVSQATEHLLRESTEGGEDSVAVTDYEQEQQILAGFKHFLQLPEVR